MIVWLMLLAFVLWIVLFRFRRRRMYQLASLIHSPKDELPVIGVLHKLCGNTEDIMTTLKQLSYESMDDNGLIRVWMNHILLFINVNPVDAEVILKTCMEKDDLHKYLREIVGYAGIFAPVSIWKRRRKIVMPTLAAKVIDNFFEAFMEQSDKLTYVLSSQAGTGAFDIWPHLSAYTLDSICETTVGVKMNTQYDSSTSMYASLDIATNIACKRIFHLWLRPEWLFKLSSEYNAHEKHRHRLHDFVDEVVRKKKLELEQAKKCQLEANDNFGPDSYRKKTSLEFLLAMSDEGNEKVLNNLELREEILTLFVAGTETSSLTIGYTLKLLSKYPKIQEKLYSEIHEVLGETNRAMTRDDLKNLKYLDMVVKESFRLFPPVPFVARKIETETKLPSGVILPAGSGVILSIWGAHRDPKYWGPDADCFDPDRFSPERYNLQHACSFMPFSNGPRNCLGYHYALMSIKIALAKIIRSYKVVGEEESSPVPHVRVQLDVMLKPVEGLKVVLERRQ